MEGTSLRNHVDAPPAYLPNLDPGRYGGGTYTGQEVEPTLEAYENIFGPSARDIKQDLQRFKRHGRWHLPDILKGPNQYLTDRIDGLITDAQNSPFTSRILPYKYITNVDGKIKWNVWSFDEGLSSRVPYESAARTLTQSKRSYAGYTIRQGMAIVLEHNFMMTEAGRTNFRNQLNQLIGSIQLTNDLDVHVALVLAPSYQKTMNEKYLSDDRSPTQTCREFVDLFGFVQKNQNALDILIEEAKAQLKMWGAPMPDFMLCNSKLTFQLTMTPDATNYVTKGAEGVKRLRTGPDLPSYRGIGIIHTRAFSMETGVPPRDILRRRVRVAEYYRILPHQDNHKRMFQLYNEEQDTWASFTFADLLKKARVPTGGLMDPNLPGHENHRRIEYAALTLGGEMPGERGLGSVYNEGAGVSIEHKLADFFKDAFNGKLEREFYKEPEYLDENIVYVPGAVDWSQGDIFYLPDKAKADAYPEFIRGPLLEWARESHKSGMDDVLGEEARKVSMQVQSVAAYPRNALTFIEGMKAQGNDVKYLKLDFASIIDVPDGGAAVGHEAGAFFLALAQRNYNRYGVPVGMFRTAGAWASSVATKYEDVFDFTNELEDVSKVHPHHQQLRERGAFFCPNHFKNRAASSPAFPGIGNYVGYNMLLAREMIQALTLQSKPSKTPYMNTLLYDVVTNFKKVKEALAKPMKDLLNKLRDNIEKDKAYSRARLAEDANLELAGALVEAEKICKCPAASKYTDDDSGALFYWTWPRTGRFEEEVFSTDNKSKSAAALQGDTDFKKGPILNFKYLKLLAAVKESEVLTLHLSTDGIRSEASDQDVEDFFHVLAWRLWADQERPLEEVFTIGGRWPSPSQYLNPKNYAPLYFGGAVLRHGAPPGPGPGVAPHEARASEATKDIELVIVRPNIEHHMLGIILGQGGESLGSTFWGQTELSCYDDSMHGIWGMSYKYNERAIVINERNLVRLWDIAYDGYVGGKDDTAVDWGDSSDRRNSAKLLRDGTMDVTRPYRGPSMMVMAFDHGDARRMSSHARHYASGFQPNWPSPIVFYDRGGGSATSMTVDFDNIHVVSVDEFRVFNRPLYQNAYEMYKAQMPDFYDLHHIRKNAGLAAVENEVSSDALAFQGTMRIVSGDRGAVIHETMGSGHHGPDFIGCASLRAGKGYKINSQPTIQRLV